MPNLQLSDDEAAVLRAVLEADVTDLRMEIANTDSKEFRDDLKRKEASLRSMLERLAT